jgi:hypothetical protein
MFAILPSLIIISFGDFGRDPGKISLFLFISLFFQLKVKHIY